MRIFTSHVLRERAAYADGELAPRNAAQVERHIRQCGLCQAEYQQVQSGMAMVEQLPSVEAPAAIWASIEAKLETGSRAKPSHTWRWALAATVVLAVAGIEYWRVSHGSGSQ